MFYCMFYFTCDRSLSCNQLRYARDQIYAMSALTNQMRGTRRLGVVLAEMQLGDGVG